MQATFKFKLVGNDELEATFDTQNDDWEEFYLEVCALKAKYRESVGNSIEERGQTKSTVKPAFAPKRCENNSLNTILKKAVNADTRPISEAQLNILVKAGYDADEVSCLNMKEASVLVKSALEYLNR